MCIRLCASSSSIVLNREKRRSVLAALTNRSGRRRLVSVADNVVNDDDIDADADSDATCCRCRKNIVFFVTDSPDK
jgi:hypothetical protein